MKSREKPPGSSLLSASDFQLIDKACNEFEDAFQNGQSPRIEDFLANAPKKIQGELLRDLLLLEFDYVSRDQTTISSEEYLARFPGHREIVLGAFREAGRRSRAAAVPFVLSQINASPPATIGSAGVTPAWPAAGKADTQTPPRHVGNYEILEKLGEGGMGVVYKARHQTLGRIVALKMILAGSHAREEDLVRFLAEAEAVARLNHPNIVQLHDFGQQDGFPYFTLELVTGGNLHQKLRDGPLEGKEACRLIEQLARGMNHAHEAGIVHRDLKPHNVLLAVGQDSDLGIAPARSESCPTYTPKITDFGLAKRVQVGSGLTATGAVMGTPSYMAPEQASGDAKHVGPAADIYALGAILYECVTGRPPFQGPTPLQTLAQVAAENPVPPRRLQPTIDSDLETICLKCLQKERHRRYATAMDLGEDIGRYLRGEPITARSVGAAERGWRWCRRNPRLAIMGASIAFLVLLALTFSSVAAVVFRQQRDQIETALTDLGQKTKQVKTERDRAVKAEKAEREKRAEALFQKAQGGRWSGQMGRRFGGLQALADATDLLLSLDLPPHKLQPRLLKYRNEAIACMALPDFKVVKTWDALATKKGKFQIDFDPLLEYFAKSEDDGSVTLRRFDDNKQIASFSKPGAEVAAIRFSADGRFLAVSYTGRKDTGFCVWDVERTKPVLQSTALAFRSTLDFSPDGRFFGMATSDGTVHVFDVSKKIPVSRLTAADDPSVLRFSPDGSRLAITSRRSVLQIWNWRAKHRQHQMFTSGSQYQVDWSPDGKYVAAGCFDRNAHVWDAQSGNQVAVLKGHRNGVGGVAFHPSGRFLVTNAWDGTTRLWDFHSQQELLRTNGLSWRFSPDGQRLSFISYPEVGVWEVNLAMACRILYQPKTKEQSPASAVSSACSPGGNLVATCCNDGLYLWDRSSWQLIRRLDLGGRPSATFHPINGALLTSSPIGVLEWPIQRMVGGTAGSIKVGPPKPLVPGVFSPGRITVAADGSAIAVVANRNKAIVLHTNKKKPVAAVSDRGLNFVALSADGKWLATSDDRGTGVTVWDAATGSRKKEINTISRSFVAFSPDGKWLVTCDGAGAQFWHVGSWEKAHSYPDSRLACPEFSPNGKVLAVGRIQATREPNAVHLVEAATGRLLAKLENTPAPTQIEEKLCFTPDGRHIIVPHWTDGVFCVWNLESIWSRLADMKLARALPELSDSNKRQSKKPISWTIDLGDLPLHLALRNTERHINSRRWSDALAEANKVIDSDKLHLKAWLLRGRAYLGLKKTKKGIANLQKYLKLKKAKAVDYDKLAWMLAKERGHETDVYRQAITWSNRAIFSNIFTAENMYFGAKGVALYRSGDYKQALVNLQIAHTAFSLVNGRDDPFGAFFIAMAYAKLTDKQTAEQNLNTALQWFQKADAVRVARFPDDTDLRSFRKEAVAVLGDRLTSRGYAHFKAKKHADALRAYNHAVKIGFHDVGVYHIRGHALEEQKQYAKALADFKEASRLMPGNAHFLDEIALLCSLGPKKIQNPEYAIEAAKAAVKVKPQSSSSIRTIIGIAHFRLGEIEKAVHLLEKTPDEKLGHDRKAFKYLFLAMCCQKKGMAEEAKRYQQQALAGWRLVLRPSNMMRDMYERIRAEAGALLKKD